MQKLIYFSVARWIFLSALLFFFSENAKLSLALEKDNIFSCSLFTAASLSSYPKEVINTKGDFKGEYTRLLYAYTRHISKGNREHCEVGQTTYCRRCTENFLPIWCCTVERKQEIIYRTTTTGDSAEKSGCERSGGSKQNTRRYHDYTSTTILPWQCVHKSVRAVQAG